jgi:hypothetical protein
MTQGLFSFWVDDGHVSALAKFEAGLITAVCSGCLHKQCSHARFSVLAV